MYTDMGVECIFEYECDVQSSIRGTQDFVLELPEAFQYMEWTITSSFWSPDIPTSRFGSILATNSSLEEQPLAGTKTDPTTFNFGAIRSSHEDEFVNVTKTALQLFWRGTKKKMGTIESGSSSSYTHYVAFRFQVEENIYISKLLRKLDFSSMLSVLIAYTLTALSVLGTGKMFCQKGIDALMRRRARKTNEKVPSDVLRRERILDEHLLTQAGSRRMSMSVDGGGGPERQRRLSSRELLQQDKGKPKKQRRLSSRELMQQEEEGNATAVDIGIEMTAFGSGRNNGSTAYSNPMRKNVAKKGSGRSRRHSSFSLSAFEAKTVNAKIGGGGRGD
jgi:hypothetical protein